MNIKSFIKPIIKVVLSIMPKSKNKIIFESNSDFCDNSRAVYEYMIKNNYNKKYKLIWCVKDPAKYKFYKEKNVYFTSFRSKKYIFNYMFHICTSKTVMYTHAIPPFINTKHQTVVCLWHGTPLKLMEHRKAAELPFNFILSASEWCSTALADCFLVPDNMIKILGYPRCDLLFEQNNAFKELNIDKSKYKKVILWMPTFRQSSELNIFDSKITQTGLPLVTTSENLFELNVVLNQNNSFMLIKLHPLQDLTNIDFVSLSNIKMITNAQLEESDVQLYHLVANSDALLTDYSSIYFDFLLLNRPIGFLIDDFDEYNNNRGFVVENPLDYMPGDKIKTVGELHKFINNISNGIDSYCKERAKVLPVTNRFTDNQSCKRLLDMINIID